MEFAEVVRRRRMIRTYRADQDIPEVTVTSCLELAVRAPVGDRETRMVLALLAAYRDAGERSPSMAMLSDRLAMDPVVIDGHLDDLIAAGLLRVQWAGRRSRGPGQRGWRGRRNRYKLLLDTSS